jgi:acetylornithine deacetylase
MDTKGGLAAFMIATAAAAKRSLKGDVIFTGVVDEEFASLGTESIVGHVHADAAIVAEPSALEIQTCHKGFVWLEVETAGVAAHGSRFEEGVDAIAKMGKFLVALDELSQRLESRPSHPVLGPPSVHASLITGGQELSSYPASCRVSVERRTLPNESRASVQSEFQELLDGLRVEDPKFIGSCRTTFSRDSLEVGMQSEIVEILARHVHRHLGREPVVSGSSGWTDAALLATAGIPSIIFGPAGEGPHATLEWVDLESARSCCSIVLAAITEFCGG